MHKHEISILSVLQKEKECSLAYLSERCSLDSGSLLWALENLKEKGFVEVEKKEEQRYTVTDEGKEYAKGKMPEEELFAELQKSNGVKIASLSGKKAQIGLTWLKRAGLIEITDGVARLSQKSPSHFQSEDGDMLRKIANGDADYRAGPEALGNLLKRGLIRQHTESRITRVSITGQGMNASLVSDDSIGQLTRSIISSGAWEGRNFKPYEISAPVEPARAARRHPLRETISEIKNAYLSMGFSEVSGPMVEPAFWVFDSLFVPQDHPARDVQDTFYLSNPEHLDYEQEYEKTVRRAHKGSWKSKWDKRIAESAMLRTHTTSVSSRYIYRIIREIRKNPESYNLPIKLFSIGRIFRNENIDYKHLADFYMHDGIIIGKRLTLSNLFDTLIKIYASMGIKITFKPSYFPFVEPGAEFYALLAKSGEMVELGGSGIIRKEITGLKRSSISVLAWGAGVERILLIKNSKLNGISELYNSGIGISSKSDW